MIESIHFQNVKALRDATLPLEPVTVLLGPNGSGKSTVIECLATLKKGGSTQLTQPIRSLGSDGIARFEVRLRDGGALIVEPHRSNRPNFTVRPKDVDLGTGLDELIEVYDFEVSSAGAEKKIDNAPRLDPSGKNLVNVFQHLKDEQDEVDNGVFDQVNSALRNWLPEYARIALKPGSTGNRTLWLRLAHSDESLPVHALSAGTKLSLCFLGIAYQKSPPSVICIEEPDVGLHPRLLRLLRDAIYRLAYPEEHGEVRNPVQVILTTHNPYFVDEFKEHPEQVVLAEKKGLDVTFKRLSDDKATMDNLYEMSLGEAWYSGLMGGIPSAL